MALILQLETATPICSVSLSKNGSSIALAEDKGGRSHASKTTILIQNVLDQAGFKLEDIDAVAVSAGPGSYTGLRIGTSVAKGLCYSLEIPLIAVSSLESLAQLMIPFIESKDSLLMPCFDARREDGFYAIYDADMNCLRPAGFGVLNSGEVPQMVFERTCLIAGTAAQKTVELLQSSSLRQIPVEVSARGMDKLAFSAFSRSDFADTAYFSPHYLKEFYSPSRPTA